MRDETTAYIRTHITSAAAYCKEIDRLHGGSGCLHTVQNRAATCFYGTAQIALIQLIRGFLAIQGAFQIKMAMINIAIQVKCTPFLSKLYHPAPWELFP